MYVIKLDKIKKVPGKYCVIVDGYASGSFFSKEFRALGLLCIHVQSNDEIKIAKATFNENDFVLNLKYNNNFDELITQLKPYNPLFVMPGFHSSVTLAEGLGSSLGLPSNNPETTSIRMNKYYMHKALSEKGVRYAKSFLVSSKEELLELFSTEYSSKVVVKPLESTGTDNVFLCVNEDDLISAYDTIINTVNALDINNDKILIQEFLEGTEYIVNSATLNNKHVITDIWRCDKTSINNRNFVYDKTVLLDPGGAIEKSLIEYNIQVLEALDFKFGLCHNEIMLTKNGPVLIELNPRISGGNLPVFAKECTGMGQIGWASLIADAVMNQEKIFPVEHYTLKKNALTVTLISRQEGILKGYNDIDRIRNLSSYYHEELRVKKGDVIKKTTDVFTGPGIIALVNEDKDKLEKDYTEVRTIENESLYIVE